MDHPTLMLLVTLCSSGLCAELHSGSEEFRLVGGASHCSGELHLKHRQEWRPVHDFSLTMKAFQVVCHQLNCGSVVSKTNKIDEEIKPVWTIKPACMKSGSLWRECVVDYDAAGPFRINITCSDSIRLVNGADLCSGRLEVKLNNSWSSVNEDDFDQQDAEVVCRELECGPPSALQGALYGETEAPEWSREFLCEGHESALLKCRSSVQKYSGKAAGLTCSDPDHVMLVGGASRCSGELHLKHRQEWRPVHDFSLDLTMETFQVVCHQLNCGSVVSKTIITDEEIKPVWTIKPACMKSGSLWRECVVDYDAAGPFRINITCSDSIRLVNGADLCSGRLEVKLNNSWSSVNEDDFDQQDAEVVCRELECGPPSALQGALYGETEAPEWSREFLCEGHESALLKCRSSVQKYSGKAAGLTCSDPDHVMLVGGASRCSGELHLKHRQEWRPVHDFSLDLTMETFQVVCHQLNCGSVVSKTIITDEEIKPVWTIKPACMKSGFLWRECVVDYDAAGPFRINITCSDSIRLVNGADQCSGRLEVKLNNSWSSVNEDDFDQQDAEVVCRELECGPPLSLQGALYGETEAPEWSREFLCEGHESVLLDCKSSSQKFCSSGKAVDLTCSGRLRLVGMTSRCAGVLEMFNRREWRPVFVSDSRTTGNHEVANAVCSQLGCGFAVFQEFTDNSPERDVWRISSSCLKSSSPFLCVYDSSLKRRGRLEVLCSDSLESPNISVSSTSGVSKARNQGLQVFFGTSFSIICSSHHLYQGGIFQLIFNNSTTTLNNTLLTVNNSAHFSFFEASYAHQGNYICVHHVHVNSQNLTLKSQQLSLTVLVSVSLTEFIIRHVVVLLILVVSTSAIYVYFKNKSRRMQEPKRNHPDDDGPALRPSERRLQKN